MKQNYAEYHFSKTEILKYLIQSILLCGAMDYLFYQNWWLMLLTVPVTVLFMRLKKKGLIRERKRKLNYQFKDALNALSVAVSKMQWQHVPGTWRDCIRKRQIS